MSYDVHVHTDLAHLTAAPHATNGDPVQIRHAGALAAPAADDGVTRPYDGAPS